jgi:hypothetical protein
VRLVHSAFDIDRVCIDQSNLDERSHQVAIMGEIFRSADRATAWLGPAGADSDYALDLIRYLGSKGDFDLRTGDLKFTTAGMRTYF